MYNTHKNQLKPIFKYNHLHNKLRAGIISRSESASRRKVKISVGRITEITIHPERLRKLYDNKYALSLGRSVALACINNGLFKIFIKHLPDAAREIS